MKWIGQHIWDFVSRFRNDVYFENLETTNETLGLVVDADGKVSINPNSGDETAEKVHYYVKAAEDLVAGNAVYASGAVGNSQAIEVSKYIANNTIDERRFLGIMQQDLLQGEFGYVITLGTLKPVDATGGGFDASIGETWLEGDILFASPTYAGELTKVQPHAPNQVIPCAFVLKNNSNGTLAVRAYDLGYHLNEIHDVEITTPTEGEVLRYDSGSSIWENTDSLVIDSTGKVGIGTTSPAQKLDVNGIALTKGVRAESTTDYSLITRDSGGNTVLYVQSANSNTNQPIAKFNYGSTTANSGTTVLTIGKDISYFNATNVGIGTSSPGQKLTVDQGVGNVNQGIPATTGSAQNGILRLQPGGPYGESFDFGMNVATTYAWIQPTNKGNHSVNYNLSLNPNGGNVGIGTTSPAEKLYVNGRVQAERFRTTTAGSAAFAGYYFQGDADTGTFQPANNMFGITTFGTERMRIDSSGNVGIGTTSPSAKLHIDDYTMANTDYDSLAAQIIQSKEGRLQFVAEDDGNDAGYLIMTNVPASGDNKHWIIGQRGPIRNNNFEIGYKTSSAGGNIAQGDFADFVIDTTGNVGIGTTSPSEKLTVSGNISVSGDVYSDGSIHADEIKGRTYSTYNILSLEDDNLPNQNGVSLSSVGSMAFHLDVNNNSSNDSFDWKADAPTSGSATSLMRLTDEGNLGIGTASPSAKLDVAGLANINDGSENVMISSVNTSLSTGVWNSAVGSYAGYSLSTGSWNTAIGAGAMTYTTTGHSNVSVGYTSLYNVSSGAHNVGVGRNSLERLTTGNYNVAIGSLAARGSAGSQSFSNTVAVGYSALQNLTTGAYNTAVGYQAGISNTEGDDNVFVGGFAGQANTTGNNNAFFGRNAGYANISGDVNSFVGVSAGRYNTTGYSNTFVGGLAGNQNTIGYSNSFVGVNAGYSNTSGDNNSFFGRGSGYSNTTGSGNIFIGYQAGYNETGSNKLYIANSDTTTPLIYGEFDNDYLKVNGKLEADSITVDDEGLSAAGEYGPGAEIWYQGTSTPSAGYCYYLDSSGNWAAAQANAVGTTQGMLAIAAGADSDVDGMVLRGFVRIGNALTGSVGDAVYLSESSAGRFTTTKPTGAGNFVRRVGYLAKGTNVIYFNPSNEYEAL